MAQNWQKAHDASKNNFWEDLPSINSPITQDELNRNENSVDAIDDRVLTLDTVKAEQADMLLTPKTITFDENTGIFTITRWNGTTFTIDTDLEKIAINFDYDDDPTSAHYQELIITLKDGTVKYIDMSALITQYEFTDSSTISFTVGTGGAISASVIDGSITESKLQPNFLADCRAARAGAEAAEADAIAKALVSEGWAKGTQNGTPVGSTSPYYENNAEYFKNQAASIVGSKVDSFNGRTGVVTSQTGDYSQDMIAVPTGANNGQVPVVRTVGGAKVFQMETPEGVTRLQSLDMVGKTTTFNADGSISVVADDYSEAITFNANGSITDEVTINNVKTTKTTHFMGNDIIEDLHDYQGCVDLGSLTWSYNSSSQFFYTSVSSRLADFNYVNDYTINYSCKKYTPIAVVSRYINKAIFINLENTVVIQDLDYTDTTAFKNANKGVYLTYETSTQ